MERETAVAEIQQILKMPFPPPSRFPVSFFGGGGPGLGVPDAESGKKKKKKNRKEGGRKKSLDRATTVDIVVDSGRENRSGASPRTHARA